MERRNHKACLLQISKLHHDDDDVPANSFDAERPTDRWTQPDCFRPRDTKSMAHLEYFAYRGAGIKNAAEFHYSQAVRVGDRIECAGQGKPASPSWTCMLWLN